MILECVDVSNDEIHVSYKTNCPCVEDLKKSLKPIGRFKLKGITFEVIEPSVLDIMDSKHDLIFIKNLEGYDLPNDIERLNQNIMQLEQTLEIYEGILSIYTSEKILEKSSDKEFVKEVISKMNEVLSSGKIKWFELINLKDGVHHD